MCDRQDKWMNKPKAISNSYTMGCPLAVCGDNLRALASGLSYVQVDKHCRTIYTTYISVDLVLYITGYFVLKLVKVV